MLTAQFHSNSVEANRHNSPNKQYHRVLKTLVLPGPSLGVLPGTTYKERKTLEKCVCVVERQGDKLQGETNRVV